MWYFALWRSLLTSLKFPSWKEGKESLILYGAESGKMVLPSANTDCSLLILSLQESFTDIVYVKDNTMKAWTITVF